MAILRRHNSGAERKIWLNFTFSWILLNFAAGWRCIRSTDVLNAVASLQTHPYLRRCLLTFSIMIISLLSKHVNVHMESGPVFCFSQWTYTLINRYASSWLQAQGFCWYWESHDCCCDMCWSFLSVFCIHLHEESLSEDNIFLTRHWLQSYMTI